MLHDKLLTFREMSAGAVTASGTSDVLDIRGGTPGSDALFAEILYNTANTSAGAGSGVFTTQASEDNSTWEDITTRTVALGVGAANAVQGTIHVPVVTLRRYVRVAYTISGTNATITFAAFLVTGRPV